LQPYTHFSSALLLSHFVPEGAPQAAIFFGAFLAPDIPTYITAVNDIRKKKEPLAKMSELYLEMNEIFHSLAIWGFCLLISLDLLGQSCLIYFFLGVFFHLIILDWPSHRDDKYLGPGMLWPFKKRLQGFYDYHPKTGPGWLSPWQLLCSGVMMYYWWLLQL